MGPTCDSRQVFSPHANSNFRCQKLDPNQLNIDTQFYCSTIYIHDYESTWYTCFVPCRNYPLRQKPIIIIIILVEEGRLSSLETYK